VHGRFIQSVLYKDQQPIEIVRLCVLCKSARALGAAQEWVLVTGDDAMPAKH
jgi:hypothetical protein